MCSPLTGTGTRTPAAAPQRPWSHGPVFSAWTPTARIRAEAVTLVQDVGTLLELLAARRSVGPSAGEMHSPAPTSPGGRRYAGMADETRRAWRASPSPHGRRGLHEGAGVGRLLAGLLPSGGEAPGLGDGLAAQPRGCGCHSCCSPRIRTWAKRTHIGMGQPALTALQRHRRLHRGSNSGTARAPARARVLSAERSTCSGWPDAPGPREVTAGT